MSTIVVVKKNGVAAIGADTLTTRGSIHEKAKYIVNHSKIIQVADNFIASVGDASFGLVMASYFSRLESQPELHSSQTIFETARSLHVSLKADYFLNPVEDADDPFESSQYQVLLANPHGVFGIEEMRSVSEYSCFYAFGSGEKYALGAMHAVYESDLNAEEIARAGLLAAAEFDQSTGEPIEIKTIKLK